MSFILNPYRFGVSPFQMVSWTHAVWAGDPAWANPGDGNPVDSMRNNSGGGNPASTGTNRPTYRAATAAYNNKPTVEFVGALLQYLNFDVANLGQPVSLVVIGNTSGANGATEKLLGQGTATAGGLGDLSTNAWHTQFGTALSAGVCDANPHLLRGFGNGASSVVAVDGTVLVTGNAGTNILGQFTLGAGSAAGPVFAGHLTGRIAFAGITAGDVTAQSGWATFKAWVTSHYGIVVV